MIKSKIRWGDTLDDEDALPPSTVKGPDSHGIKITTEYYKNDKGEAIKKVTKVKVVNVEKKVYKVGDWSSRFSHSAMQACLVYAKPHTNEECVVYFSERVWQEQQRLCAAARVLRILHRQQQQRHRQRQHVLVAVHGAAELCRLQFTAVALPTKHQHSWHAQTAAACCMPCEASALC
jgi:hypothetical protein